MIKARNIVEPQIAWRIGEGNVNFIHDAWLKTGVIQGRLKQNNSHERLVKDFRNNDGWNTSSLNTILSVDVVNEILQIPVSNIPDKMFWKPNTSGVFTLSSCIHMFKQSKTNQLAYKDIWDKNIPQKIAFLS